MPFSGADVGVASFGDLKEIRWSAAPTVDPPVVAQRASVIAPGIKRDKAVGRSGCSGLGEGQGGEQQRGDREGDQEEFMPPPPPIG